MPNHVHMLISCSSEIFRGGGRYGFVKGKSSIWIARMSSASAQFHGREFWALAAFPDPIVPSQK